MAPLVLRLSMQIESLFWKKSPKAGTTVSLVLAHSVLLVDGLWRRTWVSETVYTV